MTVVLATPNVADTTHAARLPAPALVRLLPGFLLLAAIAGLAFALRALPGLGVLSPMILAIGIGIALRNLLPPGAGPLLAIARPGILLGTRPLLRAAIVLLGLQLTVGQAASIGLKGVLLLAATLLATFFLTRRLGRALGVDPRLAELIAAGTSICGASAVMATNSVTRGSEEDVAYAVACVTLFGLLSMFLYPVALALLPLDAHGYGLWVGASIHEIAQVVAAAFQAGDEAGRFGTIAKLTRVMMLAPLVLALGFAVARRQRGQPQAAKPPVPWFVFGFLGMVVLNSVIAIPAEAKAVLVQATAILLTMSLAAMGLETSIGRLRAKGFRPFALGAAAWAFISVFSLVLVLATT